MENKKISFGFMKTKKQDKPAVTEEQREYIESVEDNSIKIVGKEVSNKVEALIIPMKPNTLITAARLKEIAEKVESSLDEPKLNEEPKSNTEFPKKSENETLEQMAVRELVQEAKQEKTTEIKSLKIFVPSNPVIDGQKESCLDDYESVPIQEFGMAMLRGMGWTPGKETSTYKLPNLRPKGLGLGADKVIAENQKNITSKDNEKDLAIVKNAFVKITTGKYSGCYGKVVSLDEDNGRVMVNIPLKKETISLSEFMMHPVAKSEFDKQSKVINANTYEAYKKNEKSAQKASDHTSTKESESSSSHRSTYVDSKNRKERRHESCQSQIEKEKYSNGRNKDKNHRQKHDSSGTEEDSSRPKRKEKKRYSSNESLSPSDEDRRRRKKEYEKHSSSDSEKSYRKTKEPKRKSSTNKEKRDIDKKRKGKKKKRDRDRSPSYRKYRK